MMKHIDSRAAELTRRNLLGGAAGFALALTIAPDRLAFVGEAAADTPAAPTIWLTIATIGTISIVSPAAEMGQGTFTTLPAIFADELAADWSMVRPIYPPEWNEAKYGNPEFLHNFHTAASFATRGCFKAMRIAGAQARRLLIDAVNRMLARSCGRDRGSEKLSALMVVNALAHQRRQAGTFIWASERT
jgi:isoquinoline 1-oxidoreductase subunit beta